MEIDMKTTGPCDAGQLMDISYPSNGPNPSLPMTLHGDQVSNITMSTLPGGPFNPSHAQHMDEFVMPMMTREHQTLDWHQSHHYMLDSGLASVMSTHTSSVCSRPSGGVEEGGSHVVCNPVGTGGSGAPYTVMSTSFPPGCNEPMNSVEMAMGAISPNNWTTSDCSAGPTSGQISAMGEERVCPPASGSRMLGPVEDVANKHNLENQNPNAAMAGGMGTAGGYLEIDESVAATAIPELVHLIKDEEDPVVLQQAAIMVFQLSRSGAADALIEHEEMLECLLRCLDRSCNGQGMVDTVRFMTGTLYNISQRPHGLQGLYRVGAVAILVRLLSSSVESVLYYAITTLHNLLLRQDEAKQAVRDADGVRKMVALLRKDNIKFLAICTDCLQILAYSHEETKLSMLQAGAPQLLVHILETYHYEKLLWTTTRVLKVLSVCSFNKQAIIDVGGMEALTRHLMPLPVASPSSHMQPPNAPTQQGQPSSRLVLNCLWTLRNLSDAATRRDNVIHLLRTLLHLVASYTVAITATRSTHNGELILGGARCGHPVEEQPHATLQWLSRTPPPNPVMFHCSLSDATSMVYCAAGILSNLTTNQRNKLQLVREYGVHIILDCVRAHLPTPTTGHFTRGIYPDTGATGFNTDLLEGCVCVLRHLTSKYEAAELAQKAVLSGGRASVQLLVYLLALGLGEVAPPQVLPTSTEGSASQQQLPQPHWPLVKATVGLMHNVARSAENVSLLREAGLLTPLMHLLRRTEQEMAASAGVSSAADNATGGPKSVSSQSRGMLSPQPSMAGMPSAHEIRLKELIELAAGTVYLLIHADPVRRKQLLFDGAVPSHNNGPPSSSSHASGLAFFLRMIFSQHESLQLVALKILSDMATDPQGQCAIAQSSREVHFRLRLLSQSPRDDINTFASHILVRVSEGPNWSPSSGESFPSSPYPPSGGQQSCLTTPQPSNHPTGVYPPHFIALPAQGFFAPGGYVDPSGSGAGNHQYYPGRNEVVGPAGPTLYSQESVHAIANNYPGAQGWNNPGFPPIQPPSHPNFASALPPHHSGATGPMSPRAIRQGEHPNGYSTVNQQGHGMAPTWCNEPLSPHSSMSGSRYMPPTTSGEMLQQTRGMAPGPSSLLTSGYVSPIAGGQTQYSSVNNLPAAVAACEQADPQTSGATAMKWSA